MPPDMTKSFRFRDLPREIRDKIYRFLLCEFRSPLLSDVDTVTLDLQSGPVNLQKFIYNTNTSIFHTNRATYEEAFEAMVKGNCLEAFNGLVLSIDLSLSETDIAPLNNRVTREPNKPMNFMILHRDLERLCSALAAGSTVYWSGFAENVALSITMAPMLHKLSNPALQAAFKTYFSDVTQSKILAPLRSSCSGYGRVSFDSLIDKKLAAVVLEDMSREKWSDPAVLSAAISKAKEQGSTLFHAGEITTGCRYWLDAIVKLHTTRLSRSWGDLVRKGGETFLNQVAEDFFFMSLNLAQAHLDLSQDPIDQSHLNTVVMPFLTFAAQSTRENFWSTGHTFRPSDKDLAELCYRRALCLRLTSHPGSAAEALEFIDIAFRLLPQDAAIVRERQAILQWSDQT